MEDVRTLTARKIKSTTDLLEVVNSWDKSNKRYKQNVDSLEELNKPMSLPYARWFLTFNFKLSNTPPTKVQLNPNPDPK